jgi:uncharacterized protein (DUF1697 family)
MADVTQSFLGLGFADVSTYIQTGNIFFRSPSKSVSKLASEIEHQLELDFGNSPAVILRTIPELTRVAATSPFPSKGADPSRHHVTFLAEKPDAKRLKEFSPPASGRDELVVIGREVYVHTPDGYGNSKLNGAMLERRLGVVSTTRNWNTVSKLCELGGG